MFGEYPSEHASRAKVEKNKYHGRKVHQKVTDIMTDKIRSIVTKQPELFLDEIQDMLFAHGGSEWLLDPSTIWRVLTQRLRWSLRVATANAAQRDELDRQAYRDKLMTFDDPSMFVFIDESSRGVNESRRRRAWGPRGEDNSFNELFVGDLILHVACRC